MPVLSFKVQLHVVVDGCGLQAAHFKGNPDGVQCFLVGAWVGAGSPEFSLARVEPDGTASLSLKVAPGDVDTVKFGVSFNLSTPKSGRNCALASNFLPMERFVDLLGESGGRTGFDNGQALFTMSDNFTKDTVALRFLNAGTVLPAFAPAALKLRPSALRVLDRTNAAVCMMGRAMQEQITTRFAVCPLNAGPQYVQSFSYWNMQQSLTSYAVMGHLLSAMPPGVDLPWLVYDGYQAVQSTGLHPSALATLPDWALVVRYGVQLTNRHTACALTSVYNTDYAISSVADCACKVNPTEDIGRTFGKMAMGAMGVDKARPFVRPPALAGAGPSLGESVVAVAAALQARRANGLANRVSYPAISDDCENLSDGILQKSRALGLMYEGLLKQAPATPTDASLGAVLARRMDAITAKNPLFARITPADNRLLAPVLVRLGRLVHSGDWSLALTVVSAKGPEYAEGSADASAGLSGHGTVIARVRAPAGDWVHLPVEGTTYMATDFPPPPGYANSFAVSLEDGTRRTFSLADLLTTLGQNVHQIAGSSPDCTILAHIESSYDSLHATPFYVSAFYSGLAAGPGAIGCIPLDSAPPPSFTAGSKPLFGAPVMGLSHKTTTALPITAAMLGETPEQGEEILVSLRAQMDEIYPPAMDSSHVLSSFWQPCAPLPAHPVLAAPCRHTECNWAFDNPVATDHAVRVYSALAEAFNATQQADPANDGITASAFGQYLSVALRIHVPLPRSEARFTLTAVRSMRAAVHKLGLASLAACPLKLKRVESRAQVPSLHHIYMCDKGEGPVHSHRVRLA